MAHEVRLTVSKALVGNNDFAFAAGGDNGKLGTLLVSKGKVEWLPKGNSVNKKSFSWRKFAEIMRRDDL